MLVIFTWRIWSKSSFIFRYIVFIIIIIIDLLFILFLSMPFEFYTWKWWSIRTTLSFYFCLILGNSPHSKFLVLGTFNLLYYFLLFHYEGRFLVPIYSLTSICVGIFGLDVGRWKFTGDFFYNYFLNILRELRV